MAQHSAQLSKSDRLQKVLKYLKDSNQERSTMDIIKATNTCAVNSVISELRDNGIAIDCRRDGDKWLYKIA